MPNLTETDYKKMKIDESFRAYKRDDLKAIYRIKLDNEDSYHETRIITKILKMDENNQYGFAMTKPMPTGCIKEHPAASWLKFNLLLDVVDLEDKIGHLFVVDIKFDKKRVTAREYLYYEILPPIIEKTENFRCKRTFTVYQLLELFSKTADNKPKSYRCTAKSQAILFPKKIYSALFGGFEISDHMMLLESYENLLSLYV